jgi:Putative MetA-pathway of phenol degradation
MTLPGMRAMGALAALAASLPLRAVDIESREDAWWTGPMLAASAASLPQGHALIEPYLFNVISTGAVDAAGAHHAAARDQELGSLTYMLYGLTDRFTVGLIPRFFYQEPAGAPNSSGVGLGDLSLQAGFGLTQYHEGSYLPALAFVIDETLPTGRYDHLSRSGDGLGSGAYATGVSLYSQDYFWMPTGRILRARLDLTYTRSGSVPVADQSVYGTAWGFRGRAFPGDGYTVDAAAEYSLTRNWVLALDVVYQYNFNTRLAGGLPAGAVMTDSGSSYSVGFAPAIEYNWSARAGVLIGVRIISLGRNITTTVTPAVAVNLVL